jgi:protein PET117
MYQGVLRDEARVREKAALAAAASSAPSHAQPLSTPSAIVRQPAPTIDPDCEVCRISPPPQLVEVQSPSERRAEREAREREYVAQRRLAEDLGRSQSVTEGRLV